LFFVSYPNSTVCKIKVAQIINAEVAVAYMAVIAASRKRDVLSEVEVSFFRCPPAGGFFFVMPRRASGTRGAPVPILREAKKNIQKTTTIKKEFINHKDDFLFFQTVLQPKLSPLSRKHSGRKCCEFF